MDGGDSHSSSIVGAARGEQNRQAVVNKNFSTDFLLVLRDTCSQVTDFFCLTFISIEFYLQ